jgi:hypothetical protein
MPHPEPQKIPPDYSYMSNQYLALHPESQKNIGCGSRQYLMPHLEKGVKDACIYHTIFMNKTNKFGDISVLHQELQG